jgi:hypothetical protein
MAVQKTIEKEFPQASEWTSMFNGAFFVAGWAILPGKTKGTLGELVAQHVVLASGWEGK